MAFSFGFCGHPVLNCEKLFGCQIIDVFIAADVSLTLSPFRFCVILFYKFVISSSNLLMFLTHIHLFDSTRQPTLEDEV